MGIRTKRFLAMVLMRKNRKSCTLEKETADSLKLFFLLPSTTDRKEKINKFLNNVHPHPIDCAYEDFSNYSLKKKNILPATS